MFFLVKKLFETSMDFDILNVLPSVQAVAVVQIFYQEKDEWLVSNRFSEVPGDNISIFKEHFTCSLQDCIYLLNLLPTISQKRWVDKPYYFQGRLEVVWGYCSQHCKNLTN